MPHVQRRYEIFLSSSFKDLHEMRRELVMEILKMGHIPSGMEMFHAGDRQNLDVIEDAIRRCDVLVILVGARLGELVDTERPVSYVRWEYDTARDLGKPILAFLLNEAEYKNARNAIPSNDPERQYDKELDAFRREVQYKKGEVKRIVDFFSLKDVGDLRAKLLEAIQEQLPGVPCGGWVPGVDYDDLKKRVHLDETVGRNPFFRRFAGRLDQFDKLTKRTLLHDKQKRGNAEYFCARFLPEIALKNISRLFFESGSSIAYVSEEFITSVTRERWGRGLSKKLKIATNNILTFLDFALVEPNSDPFDVALEPKGPFEPYYGATFGELADAVSLPPPKHAEPLNENARPFVEREVEVLKKFFDERGMILMTASGVELNDESEFRGPHVGSYYNMLVKRCLLELRVPTIMFLDQEKFPYAFRAGQCYPVCGPDFDWVKVRQEAPLAIALATDSEAARDDALDTLAKIGFHSEVPVPAVDGVWRILAANDNFERQMALPAGLVACGQSIPCSIGIGRVVELAEQSSTIGRAGRAN